MSSNQEKESEFYLQAELHVNANLLLNSQNTTRERDWHLPADFIADSYIQELKIVISQAIRDRCTHSEMRDAKTLVLNYSFTTTVTLESLG